MSGEETLIMSCNDCGGATGWVLVKKAALPALLDRLQSPCEGCGALNFCAHCAQDSPEDYPYIRCARYEDAREPEPADDEEVLDVAYRWCG